MPEPRMPHRRSHRETFGLASQAEMYLTRALDEFHRSANPPDLWVPVDAWHRDSFLEGPQAALTARNRRLHFLRGVVLFSAIAAEAFANELLDELLTRADAAALDRLPAPEKLLLGTRIAAGESPLERNSAPMQSLGLLFKTRNRLVHPRPQGGIAAWVQDVEAPDEQAIGPVAARNAILAVADIVVLCTEMRKHPVRHGGTAKTIARNRELLDRHQALAGSSITDVPTQDTSGVPSLLDQMAERAATNQTSRRKKT